LDTRRPGLPDRLHDEARLRSLLTILRAINQARDLRSLLWLLAGETSKVLGAGRSTVFLFDPERRELWSFVAEGLSEQIWFDAKRGLAGHVFETGRTLVVNDVASDPRFNPAIDRKTGFVTRSALSVPIINTRGETIGVFQVVNKQLGDFDATDVEFLEAVAGEAAITIENVQVYESRRRMFESLITALADSIEARDPLTAGHSTNVMRYVSGMAGIMDLPGDLRRAVECAALLHDYGKIGIPDEVLRKPGALSESESAQMRSHVDKTLRILSGIQFEEGLKDVPLYAAHHHERLNGQGYPAGLAGDDISLGGRIIAVADVFEALTAQRHYRMPMSHEAAFMALASESGTAFDPVVVRALGRHLVSEGIISETFFEAAIGE
jgi:HD-GYP domain-containing protein (c-di-GMP phosphodiesterase class II)